MEHKIQFVAITFNDGSVGVMQFVLDPNLMPGAQAVGLGPKTGRRYATNKAIQSEIDRSVWNVGLVPVSWRRIDRSDLPATRAYRNAWRDNGAGIAHCMATAREIHRQHLRQWRGPRLQALDVEYQRADERNDDAAKSRVGSLKQQLRDCTKDPKIDACESVQDLLSLLPSA